MPGGANMARERHDTVATELYRERQRSEHGQLQNRVSQRLLKIHRGALKGCARQTSSIAACAGIAARSERRQLGKTIHPVALALPNFL